jgi:hypothetical protein
MKLLTERT